MNSLKLITHIIANMKEVFEKQNKNSTLKQIEQKGEMHMLQKN